MPAPAAAKTANPRDISAALFTHFWFKTAGISAYMLLFFTAYFYLLNHPQAATLTIPGIWLDELVGFQPLALPAYLSLWIYVSLPPILMTTRAQIIRYALKISALCLFAFAIFYVWPNAIAPSAIDWRQYPQVAFLKDIDAAGNACPSLHVATAVFSAVWLHGYLRSCGAGRALQTLNIVWCIAIAYSTLATKQHVALDVIAGAALGAAAAWLTGLRQHAEAACEPA